MLAWDSQCDAAMVKAIGAGLRDACFTAGPGENAWQDDVPEVQQSLR